MSLWTGGSGGGGGAVEVLSIESGSTQVQLVDFDLTGPGHYEFAGYMAPDVSAAGWLTLHFSQDAGSTWESFAGRYLNFHPTFGQSGPTAVSDVGAQLIPTQSLGVSTEFRGSFEISDAGILVEVNGMTTGGIAWFLTHHSSSVIVGADVLLGRLGITSPGTAAAAGPEMLTTAPHFFKLWKVA